MSRLRCPTQALALVAGALIAMSAGGPGAAAQGSIGSYLFSPTFDGDASNPPRFQKPANRKKPVPERSSDSAPFSGFASGAGSTGFLATGARQNKAKPTAKNPTANKPAAKPIDTFGAPPPRTTGPLPIAATLLPRNQVRRGVTPYTITDVTGTVANEYPYQHRRLRIDDKPFDPTGIQVGAFLFKPAVELGGGYDSNPARTVTAKPSWFYTVAPELTFASNWQRHAFTGELRGSYIAFEQLPSENRPSFAGRLNGRVDVTRNTHLDLEGRFLLGTDNPGSPNIQSGLSRLPIFTTWGGSAGLGQRFNRFEIALKGDVDRTVYQPSTFTDGTVLSNDTRNYNRYGTTLRGSYEITPAVKPFIETSVDRRVHDIALDLSGFRRDSDGWYAKAGTTFAATPILTGELALGWTARNYQDARLRSVEGFTIDGSLVWLASGLTTVKLSAITSVDESTLPGVSGALRRDLALKIEHAIGRWLLATLTFAPGFDDYVGSPRRDKRFLVSAALTYKLTRELQLKTELRHEWRRSNEPGNDYDANVVLFGLRLQR